jgi:hypothetical protein
VNPPDVAEWWLMPVTVPDNKVSFLPAFPGVVRAAFGTTGADEVGSDGEPVGGIAAMPQDAQ